MKTQDMYDNNSEINLKMNIDPNLKDDTILDMGDNKVSYSEIKDMYSINNQDPIRCIVYWDDIMQFTSIALIEIINNIYKFNFEVDFNHFFNRPNDYSNGLAYVFKAYEKVLPKEKIIEIRDKYYWKILEMALKSTVFISIQKTSSFFNKLGFWFPVSFQNSEMLKVGLKQLLMNDKAFDMLQFHFGTIESFHDAMKNGGYNSVITPNVQSTYNYILKNDMKRITIIGPEEHNGIDNETYKVFDKYKRLPKPNYCSISLYKEQLYY